MNALRIILKCGRAAYVSFSLWCPWDEREQAKRRYAGWAHIGQSQWAQRPCPASTPDFTAQPQVANGVSELLGEVFGDVGRHARSAVGVSVLPLDAPVEVELVVEV